MSEIHVKEGESLDSALKRFKRLKMNTAIAALMALVNAFYSNGLTKGDLSMLMLMLSPFAPHMVEEM